MRDQEVMLEKALVTGATGFLGGNVVSVLRRRGVSVRALVHRRVADLPRDVEIVACDLTQDDDAAVRAASGCDVVFHCAGAVGDRLTWPVARAVNVAGAAHAARAARRAGARCFVHVSSVAVYGFDAGVYDEKSPTRRVGEPYIDTKSEGEQACAAELAGGSTLLRIVRPSIIYGPGDTGMIPRMIELLRKRVPMIGDGSAPVGLVHVDDVVGAMLAAAEYVGNQCAFNVAGADDVTWRELVDTLTSRTDLPPPRTMPAGLAMAMGATMQALAAIGLAPNPPPLTKFAVRFLTAQRTYPIGILRDELGFAPKVPARAGLNDALDALVAPQAEKAAFAGP